MTVLYYDQPSANRPPRHLDPGERDVSSGRMLPAVFAHLVGKGLVENCPSKKEASVVNLEDALLKDKIGKKPHNMIAVTHWSRYDSAPASGRLR